MKFEAGNITKETVLHQSVGELVHCARDQSIREDEVHAAVSVEFAGGEGGGLMDPVATVILPIKGAKMQKPLGEKMHMQSTVVPTEPTMTKPRSMPSNKPGLSQNAIRTKGCVNELLRKSSHVSATINYIIVFAESLIILHSNYCFNCLQTYRYYQKRTKIRGLGSLKRRHQQGRRLIGGGIRSMFFAVEMPSVRLMAVSLRFVQSVIHQMLKKASVVAKLGRRVGVRKRVWVIELEELQPRCQQNHQQKRD